MILTKSLLHTTDTYIKKLREAGIETVQDFCTVYPRGIEDKSEVVEDFSLINIREKQAIKCRIELLTEESTRNKKLLIKAVLTDKSGFHAEAVWWNRRMLLTQYTVGETVIIYGQAKYEYGRLSWNSPDIEHYREVRREIVPVYSDVNYIPGTWIREKMNLMKNAIASIPDDTPSEIRNKKGLHPKHINIHTIHFPESIAAFERAKSELGYMELFQFQYRGIERKYQANRKSVGRAPQIQIDTDLMKSLLADLPFPLTNKQKIVLFQILKDIEKPHAMARLLQGDVGTGKTVVALLASIHLILKGRDDDMPLHRTSENVLHEPTGYRQRLQVAIMAPTEILARQHFSGNEAWLMKLGIRADLLVGSLTPRMKEDARERLKSGQTDIIFGTHALIQDGVHFSNLGLVIIDEQHRFGVDQRKSLEEYCSHSRIVPHRLNMSATPIPRTLALTLYGDQDVSILDEYPVGRMPIHTRVIREDQRIEMYRFIEEEIRQGRQVYWISPLVDGTKGGKSQKEERRQSETELIDPSGIFDTFGSGNVQNRSESKDDIASAVEMQITLSAIFPKLHIGLIHGKMSGKEKDQVMQDFYENKIHILSSTSVVEVGVNNPNASIICIEAAERFGLSQLHQFRGRVGRGVHQSYCYLFTTKEYKSERLKAMEKTNDGFELAEIDLELRGPGEVYGVRQSGLPDLHFADITDFALVSEIREDIEEWMITHTDSDLLHP